MFTIRPAVLSDLPYVYDICLKTGDKGSDASHLFRDPALIGQFFAAPYLIYSLDTCFVVEHQHVPVGYVIGVVDTHAFQQWFVEKWLPDLRAKYPRQEPLSDLEGFLFDVVHEQPEPMAFFETYPSHLHIDLLPVAQGQGLGAKMISTLLECLKEKGSKGLHLGVSAENERAIKFYKKFGFIDIPNDNTVYLGINLAN